jgi:hypothetical protein
MSPVTTMSESANANTSSEVNMAASAHRTLPCGITSVVEGSRYTVSRLLPRACQRSNRSSAAVQWLTTRRNRHGVLPTRRGMNRDRACTVPGV